MNSQAGGTDSQFLSADERAVEAKLLDYAARVSPLPSPAFADRVMAAAAMSPPARVVGGPRVWATDMVHAAGMRLRLALAQVAGGPTIPLRVRIQAGAMLIVLALLVTAGVALAAAGATTVVTWVAGPQATTAPSRPPASAQLSPSPASDPSPGATTNPTVPVVPALGGQPSQNPGQGNQPSQNPGNCGKPGHNPGHGNQPSQNPGNCPSHKPGDGNKPSSNPRDGGNPNPSHRPTASARP